MYKPPVYRQNALKRISSPEELDQLPQVINPHGWLALVGLTILVVLVALWSIFATIPITMTRSGILLRVDTIRTIEASISGQIHAVRVAAGDAVRAGDNVVTISNLRPNARQSGLPVDRAGGNLPVNPSVNQSADAMASQRSNTGNAAIDEMKNFFEIQSVSSGRVVEIEVDTGQIVEAGTPLLKVERQSIEQVPLEAILYLPSEEARQLVPGMEVHVSPVTIKREVYGFIYGTIQRVGEYPVGQHSIVNRLGSDGLAASFADIQAPVEVRVALEAQLLTAVEADITGYDWSITSPSQAELDILLLNGTPCEVEIILDNMSPLMMFWRGR
ncbi:MAG: HlyD family efflux transporter periplasmic adaptor subunit [Chloroflexota bacterium]